MSPGARGNAVVSGLGSGAAVHIKTLGVAPPGV
jgi:hypothetical protein